MDRKHKGRGRCALVPCLFVSIVMTGASLTAYAQTARAKNPDGTTATEPAAPSPNVTIGAIRVSNGMATPEAASEHSP